MFVFFFEALNTPITSVPKLSDQAAMIFYFVFMRCVWDYTTIRDNMEEVVGINIMTASE